MNDNQITVAVAELDGWKAIYHEKHPNIVIKFQQKDYFKWVVNDVANTMPYLTSRDAIIPVILKRCNTKELRECFIDNLGIERCKDTADVDGIYEWQSDGSYYETYLLLGATPRQLCIALLKATGKWKE